MCSGFNKGDQHTSCFFWIHLKHLTKSSDKIQNNSFKQINLWINKIEINACITSRRKNINTKAKQKQKTIYAYLKKKWTASIFSWRKFLWQNRNFRLRWQIFSWLFFSHIPVEKNPISSLILNQITLLSSCTKLIWYTLSFISQKYFPDEMLKFVSAIYKSLVIRYNTLNVIIGN